MLQHERRWRACSPYRCGTCRHGIRRWGPGCLPAAPRPQFATQASPGPSAGPGARRRCRRCAAHQARNDRPALRHPHPAPCLPVPPCASHVSSWRPQVRSPPKFMAVPFFLASQTPNGRDQLVFVAVRASQALQCENGYCAAPAGLRALGWVPAEVHPSLHPFLMTGWNCLRLSLIKRRRGLFHFNRVRRGASTGSLLVE